MEMEMFHVKPEMAGLLHKISNEVGLRCERTETMDDLNRAVEIADETVRAVPPDHPDQASLLNNLGVRLGMRFERTGVMEDLNRAVKVTDEAVTLTPSDHPDHPTLLVTFLSNLGNCLCTRFEQIGAIDDLNRAIKVINEAVMATPPDYPNRATVLNNLGTSLASRFERTGAIDDLNRAIKVTDEAVTAIPPDDPNRATLLSNLGNWLDLRFERTGAMDDLDRAVKATGEAVIATPPDHPDRFIRLSNLGNCLGTRFERYGAMDDLDFAVELIDDAVMAIPPDHPDRAALLHNLGNWLSTRFEEIGAMDDLDRAIKVTDEAVMATPPGHSDRAGRLSNLGSWLHMRFERTGAMDDLDRAVKVADEAVTATPPNHPHRANCLFNLGNCLARRFERTGAEKDIKQSLLSFKEGWNCENATPIIRINLAKKAATLLASQSDWKESSVILQGAVKILPMVSQRSLENTDKQYMLEGFAGLASMAAAIVLNAGEEPYHALKLLELGRGVIAGLLLEMRTDISDLKQEHRQIAEEFESLRDELDSPTNGIDIWTSSDEALSLVSRANRRREAGQKFDEIVATIRQQPGFENFLLPPAAGELMAAAHAGPVVVVNASPYRCDAFIIKRDRIRLLELPNLSLQEVNEKVEYLGSNPRSPATSSLLEWLWDVAAGPILETLGFTQTPFDDNWPHVWWILTGALSHLPFHAAGRHAKGSTETVLDRVMSSYSSSVKALIYGRRHSFQKSAGTVSDHALLVAMPKTPYQSALPSATDEVDMLNGLFPLLQLTPVQPPELKKDVLEHLRACKIFHFAGHGQSDPREPSRSCLLLKDWKNNPLTVGDLRDSRLQENSPFLGYLSACSTGANKADELLDEGIHLISACQLAGFRHVVGTLWGVSDRHCVNVAKVLYETLRVEGMTDVAVCRGLHRAIRALRDSDNAMRRETREGRDAKLLGDESRTREREKPLYWVPYIHFGV